MVPGRQFQQIYSPRKPPECISLGYLDMVSKFGNNVAENMKLIWNKKVQGANTLCLKEKQSEVVCLTSLIKSSHGMS